MAEAITHASATSLARRIQARELSSRDVVGAHLDRIAEVDDRVNAIVAMFDRDDILAEAGARDDGPVLGPLHGLPVAVKDLEDVAGLPTREGSTTTPPTPVATDGYVAQRLRAAGAVIIGKTNTPEFGTGSHTFNDVYGTTRNPWDLERSAGGSSGGAAAALAARMVPIADGSDLGGSLRNPAGFCNVVGLRPSIGRVASPVETSTHLVRLSVRGPMARSVADTALVLSALAGPDGRDPLSLPDDPASFSAPFSPTVTARIGWAGDLGLFTCDAEILEICRRAVARIDTAGGSVVDIEPDLGRSMSVFRVLRGLGYVQLGRDIGPGALAQTKATIQENVAYGRALSIDDVLDAERDRAWIHLEMLRLFDHIDVVALPTTQVAPFPVELEYPVEISGTPMVDYLDWMTSCCVITPTGCPALSLPAGFTESGLPVGLQLVAPVGAERKLLEVAAAIEAVEPLHERIPPI